jgi:hypothetical protein
MILKSDVPISGFEMSVDRGKTVVNSVCSMTYPVPRDLQFGVKSQGGPVELPSVLQNRKSSTR